MSKRTELQDILENVLGSQEVYFQSPGSTLMKYPAIVYSREVPDTKFADNIPYSWLQQYQVTVMDSDPDSDIPSRVGRLPMCKQTRVFESNRLYHTVFSLYF